MKKIKRKHGEGHPAVLTLRFSLHHSFQQQDAKAAAAFYLLGRTELMIAERELSFIPSKNIEVIERTGKWLTCSKQKLENEGCTGTGPGCWLINPFYFKQLLHDTVYIIQT